MAKNYGTHFAELQTSQKASQRQTTQETITNIVIDFSSDLDPSTIHGQEATHTYCSYVITVNSQYSVSFPYAPALAHWSSQAVSQRISVKITNFIYLKKKKKTCQGKEL